jgi:SAM-dependent methyltransferase
MPRFAPESGAAEMGIDNHGLNFLRYARARKPFGDTITLGRQGVLVLKPILEELLGTCRSYAEQPYCEELLTECFDATRVESIDKSAYEKATHIHDFNEPLPGDLYQKYDTVLDMGTLEHIYNAPQAFKNCSQLCKRGGQLLHVLPANNFCGHGLWQFSPELFFSLYCKSNGYIETEVFLADLANTAKWYRVKEPAAGERVNVSSSTPLYVLVRTVLSRTDFSHTEVQQLHYVHEWENRVTPVPRTAGTSKRFKEWLKRTPLVYRSLAGAYNFYLRSKRKAQTGLNERNPGIVVVDVKSCI